MRKGRNECILSWCRAGIGILFAITILHGMTIQVSADEYRNHMANSGYYNTGNVPPTVNPGDFKITWGDVWNGLKQAYQTLDNLAHGDASVQGLLTGSGTTMNDPKPSTYRPGNHPEVDAGVGAVIPGGSIPTRIGSVVSSGQALTYNPGFESETAYSMRNSVLGFNMFYNAMNPSTGIPPVDTGIGYGVGKAAQVVDDKRTVDGVNQTLREHPEWVKDSDRSMRRSSANALINQGYDETEVKAYIHGGTKDFEWFVNRRVNREISYEKDYQDARFWARSARAEDARAHGEYERARMILEGKELEYYKMRGASSRTSTYSTESAMNNGAEKPNIYLYPVNETCVSVVFGEPDKVTVSIPEYDFGWDVLAKPDGRLKDLRHPNPEDSADGYGYLFYEADVERHAFQREKGIFLSATDREGTYREILSAYGLNAQEIDDFVEYWVSRLPEGTDYVMYPQLNKAVDAVMPVTVTPAPDAVFRLWFLFVEAGSTAVDRTEFLSLEDITAFDRHDFSMVEWGGVVW